MSRLLQLAVPTNLRRQDHVTPVLASLHWIPIGFLVNFTNLLLAFVTLCGLAPSYIAGLLQPCKPENRFNFHL